jgi:hypothetical protein
MPSSPIRRFTVELRSSSIVPDCSGDLVTAKTPGEYISFVSAVGDRHKESIARSFFLRFRRPARQTGAAFLLHQQPTAEGAA